MKKCFDKKDSRDIEEILKLSKLFDNKLRMKFLAAIIIYLIVLVALPLSALVLAEILENLNNANIILYIVFTYFICRFLYFVGGVSAQYLIKYVGLSMAEISEYRFYSWIGKKQTDEIKKLSGGKGIEKFAILREHIDKKVTYVMLVEEVVVSVCLTGIFLSKIDSNIIKWILIFPVIWIIFSYIIKIKRGKNLSLKLSARQNLRVIINEIIKNLESILAFNQFEFVVKTYKNAQNIFSRKDISVIKCDELQIMLNQVIIILSKIGFIYFYAFERVGNATQLMAGILLIDYLYQPLFSVRDVIQNYQEIKIEYNRLLSELTFPRITDTPPPPHELQKNLIVVDNVSFKYGNKKEILKNVNLVIPSKGCIVITGESGEGKTTLLKLLLGIYKPSIGEITYGEEFSESKVSYMEQFPVIYSLSIKENLTMGKNMTEMKIREICKKVKIDCMIDELPNKYETILAEKGKNLSGGQAQRIVLARTLLRDSNFLILDEPTSALDSETEKYIWDIITEYKKKKAILIITHNNSLFEYADIIYELKNGRVNIKES